LHCALFALDAGGLRNAPTTSPMGWIYAYLHFEHATNLDFINIILDFLKHVTCRSRIATDEFREM
jgi:hypothetical protein